MNFTMRRASILTSSILSRTVAAASPTVHYRLLTTTTPTSNSNARRFWSSTGSARAVAGALASVAAVASLSYQEVHAKEPLPADLVPKEVILYQYEACPFCNKVKAFLDYYDIPYKVIEVNPLSKKEIKWSDYKKVPILMVDGEQLVDSSVIIDKLGDKIIPQKRLIQTWMTMKRKSGMGGLIITRCMSYLQTYTGILLRLLNHLTILQATLHRKITVKYAGAAAMYFVSKKLKKKYNITDERASLYEAAETWVNALNGREFLGGSKPNLADLAVFGVLRPIRYLKSGRDMVENTRIREWYTRMENTVGETSRLKA